jgi:PDZ domain-containing secreted protein
MALKISINGGAKMKRAISLCLIVFVLLTFVGVALAAEMSGEVTAVDAAKGSLTLKSGTVEVGYDCEVGSLVKDVKVGDQVTVKYKEEGGKKIATQVTPITPMKKKANVGC